MAIELRYGAQKDEVMDIQAGGSDVLLMLVHGGGWFTGTRRDGLFLGGHAVDVLSARYGLNVTSCDYPMALPLYPTSPSSMHPGVVGSVIAACDYAHEFVASVSGRRVRRTVLLGASAGSNIARLACIARPDWGFVGFCGAYDLTARDDFRPDVQAMIDIYCANNEQRRRLASPALYSVQPHGGSLLYHGDADDTISPRQSLQQSAMHGGELNILGGAGHSFPIFGTAEDPAPWMERIIRFCYEG